MQNKTTPHANVDPVARRNARRLAIQALYQWHLVNAPVNEIEEDLLRDLEEHNPEKRVDLPYFLELIHSIPNHHPALDEQIVPFLTRKLQDVDAIELCVLRLGVYELLHHPELHSAMIINEALELVKRFGGADGHKFVNSILDRAAKSLRPHEFKPR